MTDTAKARAELIAQSQGWLAEIEAAISANPTGFVCYSTGAGLALCALGGAIRFGRWSRAINTEQAEAERIARQWNGQLKADADRLQVRAIPAGAMLDCERASVQGIIAHLETLQEG